MGKLYVYGALTLLYLIFGNSVNATHLAGGELSYESIGNGKYIVSYNLYRDCSGMIFSTTSRTLRLMNNCGQTWIGVPSSQHFVLPYIGSEDLTQVCAPAKTKCNGGSAAGYSLLTWRDTITLPTSTCTSGWRIALVEMSRSSTTNLSRTGSQGHYLEIGIYNQNNTNKSSPKFIHKPVILRCTGPDTLGFNAIDADGDSLVYDLRPPRISETNSSSFNFGYSASIPIPGTSLNTSTGELTYNVNTSGSFFVAVRVRAYDRATKKVVSESIRDYNTGTAICSGSSLNNLPQANATGVFNVSGGTKVNNNLISVRASKQVCFSVSFTDADASDSLSTSNNSSVILSGSSSSVSGINPDTTRICWTPTASDTGVYFVNFKNSDNNCPVNGRAYNTVAIRVVDNLSASIKYSSITCAGRSDGKIMATPKNGVGPYSYQWKKNNIIQNDTGNTLSSLGKNDTVQLRIIELSTNDTLILLGLVCPKIPGPSVVFTTSNNKCNGDTSGSIRIGINGGIAPYSFLWSNGDTSSSLLNIQAGNYTVTVSDSNNCTVNASDTVKEPLALTGSIQGVDASCHSASDGRLQIAVSGGTLPATYLWSNNATTSINDSLNAGVYQVTVTDKNQCVWVTSDTVKSKDIIAPTVIPKKNVTLYLGSNGMVNFSAADVDSMSFDNCSPISLAIFPSSYSCNNLGKQWVVLEARDSSLNVSYDSTQVTVLDTIAPVLTCSHDISYCAEDTSGTQVFLQTPQATDNCYLKNIFQTGGPVSGSIFSIGNHRIEYQASDSMSNQSTCFYNIEVKATPFFSFGQDTVLCGNQSFVLVSSLDSNTHFFQWNNSSTYASILITTAGDWSLTATNASNGCSYSDTINVSYEHICAGLFDQVNNVHQLKVFPNPVRDVLNIKVPELALDKATIQLYNLNGKVVMSKSIASRMFGNDLSIQLDEEVAAGKYTLILNNKGVVLGQAQIIIQD